jgi:hypothetical protein
MSDGYDRGTPHRRQLAREPLSRRDDLSHVDVIRTLNARARGRLWFDTGDRA